jgi:hypothetical protein
MLDCAWSGTAHDSTTTISAGQAKVKQADVVNPYQGTWRFNFKAFFGATSSATHYVMSDGLFKLYHDPSDDRWKFADYGGTIGASGTQQTFGVGDELTLHATYGPSGLALYKDGALLASGGTFTAGTIGTNVFIGTDSSGTANYLRSIIQDAVYFPQAMTAAQVLADYNNSAELARNELALHGFPWMWTARGGGTIDNTFGTANFISSVDKWASGVIGGVAGSYPAQINLNTHSNGLSGTVDIYVSRFDTTEFVDQAYIYVTSPASTGAYKSFSDGYYEYFSGKESVMLQRAGFAGTVGIYSQMIDEDTSNIVAITDSIQTVGAGTANKRLYTGQVITFPDMNKYIYADSEWTNNVEYWLTYGNGLGVSVEWIAVLLRPFAKFFIPGLQPTTPSLHINKDRQITDLTGGDTYYNMIRQGDQITLAPNRVNYLTILGGSQYTDPGTAAYWTVNDFKVIPRYGIL